MDTDFSNKQILIVEAFKVFRDIIKQAALSLRAEKVDVCSNSKEALLNCKTNQYDIIFMGYDLGEGKKNGQQTLEELRVNNMLARSTIFILITAESSQEMVLCALEHKPDCYITKPFTTKELLKRLFIVMHKKHTFRHIYDALDDNDSELAIKYCDNHISNSDKYIDDCLEIKAQQLFELERYDEAQVIYEQKQDDSTCQWASIGLGKIYLIKKQYDKAAKVFSKILEEQPKYIAAYEWLAKSYQALGDYDLAENVLLRAIETSPRSINLVQQYASICERNGHYEESVTAYKHTLDLAKNSIHHSPLKAFEFARVITDYGKELPVSRVKELNMKAMKELADASREATSKEIKVRVNLATACLYYGKRDKLSAEQSLKEAEKQCEKYATELPPSIKVDLAKSYAFMEMEDKANSLLNQVVDEHGSNDNLMAQVDQFVEDPLSEQGKRRTQEIIKTGINFYNKENYQAAIIEFTTALEKFPKHIGIQLNLIQALIMSYTKNNTKVSHINRAKQMLDRMQDMPRKHQHFARVVGLRDKLREAESVK